MNEIPTVFAYSDKPVQIIWIDRTGKELKQETISYHHTESIRVELPPETTPE